MSEVRIKKKDESEIDTILASDIDFDGVINFEKPLMVKGKVTGEILARGDLYVDENAAVEAKVEANIVSARGKIKGNIKARSKVELFSSAVVTGDIVCPEIEIESGCKFNGYCNMGGKKSDDDGNKINNNGNNNQKNYEYQDGSDYQEGA
ncbi:MAG: polymer-forming cytoskeletal protein [Spirochaetales bacterium]|nr:polymer-forming cytoskeletal protein [Spirochaetales bacterium]